MPHFKRIDDPSIYEGIMSDIYSRAPSLDETILGISGIPQDQHQLRARAYHNQLRGRRGSVVSPRRRPPRRELPGVSLPPNLVRKPVPPRSIGNKMLDTGMGLPTIRPTPGTSPARAKRLKRAREDFVLSDLDLPVTRSPRSGLMERTVEELPAKSLRAKQAAFFGEEGGGGISLVPTAKVSLAKAAEARAKGAGVIGGGNVHTRTQEEPGFLSRNADTLMDLGLAMMATKETDFLSALGSAGQQALAQGRGRDVAKLEAKKIKADIAFMEAQAKQMSDQGSRVEDVISDTSGMTYILHKDGSTTVMASPEGVAIERYPDNDPRVEAMSEAIKQSVANGDDPEETKAKAKAAWSAAEEVLKDTPSITISEDGEPKISR